MKILRSSQSLNGISTVLIQQFSNKSGLKNLGKEGDAYVTKQLTQNHDIYIYFPLDTKTLNAEQCAESLTSLMFLVENRDDIINDISCAYINKQIRRPG